jgi:Mn-dependent DtxR family transcriptional regulator
MITTAAEDIQKKVLQTLAGFVTPAGSKELAQVAGLDGKEVTKAIKSLKSKGLVDSPVRCKYAVTPTGASEASA